jgi:hypothetical protein
MCLPPATTPAAAPSAHLTGVPSPTARQRRSCALSPFDSSPKQPSRAFNHRHTQTLAPLMSSSADTAAPMPLSPSPPSSYAAPKSHAASTRRRSAPARPGRHGSGDSPSGRSMPMGCSSGRAAAASTS